MYIYILTKFYKHMIINEGEPGLKRKSEGKKHKNGPILQKMNFTMQMKVGNCSLDQNPTLL